MNGDDKLFLLSLIRKVETIDKGIMNYRSSGTKEPQELREEFFNTEAQISNLLSKMLIIDFGSEHDKKIIRKLVCGRFVLQEESLKLKDLQEKYGDAFIDYLRDKYGIDVSDEEIEDCLENQKKDFLDDMEKKVGLDTYFERKKNFGSIITDLKIPEEINDYFNEVRDCYYFGKMRAVIGLCRVIIELSFKDIFRRRGLARKIQHVVIDIDELKIREIIRTVCKERKLEYQDVSDLYNLSSKILHGSGKRVSLDPKEIDDFMKKVFTIIEKVYSY
jgi:hypothetical protein